MTAAQEAINRQTWKQRLKTYKRTPLSFVLLLLVAGIIGAALLGLSAK